VKRHIGRAPNVKPQGKRERVLWLGWFLVVAGWLALPFVVQPDARFAGLRLQSDLLHPIGFIAGLTLSAAGYAGTLWCYAAMGDLWRMGIDHGHPGRLVCSGPYRTVRHPIYSFQLLMLAGSAFLLPAWLAVGLLAFHCGIVMIKALDEEAFLLREHGDEYRLYQARTGRLLPRFPGSGRSRGQGSA
jgi:protein-S-isoprenylcysteine O-methyltransferase Ste14